MLSTSSALSQKPKSINGSNQTMMKFAMLYTGGKHSILRRFNCLYVHIKISRLPPLRIQISDPLSQPAELVCNCRTPAHPDELLVGCTSQDCGQWLHEKCLRHAVLKQVYDRVGTEKPHSSDINSDMTVTPTQIAALSSGADGAKDISNPFPSKLASLLVANCTMVYLRQH